MHMLWAHVSKRFPESASKVLNPTNRPMIDCLKIKHILRNSFSVAVSGVLVYQLSVIPHRQPYHAFPFRVTGPPSLGEN